MVGLTPRPRAHWQLLLFTAQSSRGGSCMSGVVVIQYFDRWKAQSDIRPQIIVVDFLTFQQRMLSITIPNRHTDFSFNDTNTFVNWSDEWKLKGMCEMQLEYKNSTHISIPWCQRQRLSAKWSDVSTTRGREERNFKCFGQPDGTDSIGRWMTRAQNGRFWSWRHYCSSSNWWLNVTQLPGWRFSPRVWAQMDKQQVFISAHGQSSFIKSEYSCVTRSCKQ